MDDKQRRFKIKQMHNYQAQARDLNKLAKIHGWFVYGCIALSFMCFKMDMPEVDITSWTQRIPGIAAWVGIGLGIDQLRAMIGIMSEKAGLDNIVTDLEYQVNNAELENNEESRGPRL